MRNKRMLGVPRIAIDNISVENLRCKTFTCDRNVLYCNEFCYHYWKKHISVFLTAFEALLCRHEGFSPVGTFIILSKNFNKTLIFVSRIWVFDRWRDRWLTGSWWLMGGCCRYLHQWCIATSSPGRFIKCAHWELFAPRASFHETIKAPVLNILLNERIASQQNIRLMAVYRRPPNKLLAGKAANWCHGGGGGQNGCRSNSNRSDKMDCWFT